jgi:hypothetical protein
VAAFDPAGLTAEPLGDTDVVVLTLPDMQEPAAHALPSEAVSEHLRIGTVDPDILGGDHVVQRRAECESQLHQPPSVDVGRRSEPEMAARNA